MIRFLMLLAVITLSNATAAMNDLPLEPTITLDPQTYLFDIDVSTLTTKKSLLKSCTF